MTIEYAGPRGMESLFSRLGYDKFDRIVEVRLQGRKIDDQLIGRIAKLPYLRLVALKGTSVSEEGLRKLRGAKPDCEIQMVDANVRYYQ